MINIGKYNNLKINRRTDFGLYLADEEGEEVLLPNAFVTDTMEEGQLLNVFVYTDSEDRMVATTQHPYVIAGEFAYLKVKEVTDFGAFMDIGLSKDLLIPFRNQSQKMQPGKSYLVYVYLDDVSERLVGTDRIRKLLSLDPDDLKPGDEVGLLVGEKTDLGFFTVVNQKYHGLLYEQDLFQEIRSGDKCKGYVTKIREDGKIDVTLEEPGYGKVEPNAQKILDYLKSKDGYMKFTDKSDPEEIKSIFKMSKKTFKKAIGSLYKERKVKLEKDGVRLLKP